MVACGASHSLFLVRGIKPTNTTNLSDPVTLYTSVYATGDGSLGQLGLGNDIGVSEPQLISYLLGKKHAIIHVCAGENHSMALDETGKLWTFGCNKFGQVKYFANDTDLQLGLGTTGGHYSIPQRVKSLPPVVQIACGSNHSAAMTGNFIFWNF